MRVAENLNAALHGVLGDDPDAYLLGEDILDPYGGAFKITRGLSERFPGRVLGTPISENAITGIATGLALAGDTAIVEIMFADFVALAFDQIYNCASKSVTMFGSRVPMRLVVRCPSGGGRGYGPTHSQSPMKHFIGMPGLALYEMSPLHDNRAVFAEMLGRAQPCLFFEDKVLYTRRMYDVPAPFRWEAEGGVARVWLDERPDCVIVAPGGMVPRALEAMRSLLLESEISCTLVVPSRLYPFTADVPAARAVVVVEESTAGGTWGSEVAQVLHRRLWGSLRRPVTQVSSRDSVIPAAAHLEREVIVDAGDIREAVKGALRD
ncbi:alpha-ketoacid dehydrogenase subunit beta [Nonomuraea sp. NPDC050663]|uniref:alpha-ketoacid dehydrogenase subunit beta n=1 Tax=Nonomuraea sp. NPDC050663 TaxID=3364370 RepID=UPI0037BBA855